MGDAAIAMNPEIAAYLRQLDTVPGWFSALDFRIFVEIDRIQREDGVIGDLFEIGAFYGKSAILLAYMARLSGSRLVVCDLFENTELADDENLVEFRTWYSDLSQQNFIDNFLRFHDELPTLLVGLSTDIDARSMASRFRFIHIDGSHKYDIVRHDIHTSHTILGQGGIVAFDDISTPHNPGSALAVWQEVLGGHFAPLCMTEAKLYGTWDIPNAQSWQVKLDRWAKDTPDVIAEIHTLAGWPVRRFTMEPVPATTVGAAEEPHESSSRPTSQRIVPAENRDFHQRARRMAHLLLPPIVVSAYRRLRLRYL